MSDMISFHEFLSIVRKKKKVTLAILGSGLYSESMMQRIEAGKRTPDRLVRNRLLARLGISSEGFDDYVQPDEYQKYLFLNEIVNEIEKGNIVEAEKKLNMLEYEISDSNKVYKQFVFAIRARIARERNSFNICKKYSKQALLMTVTSVSTSDIVTKLFSSEEYYYYLYFLETCVITSKRLSNILKDYTRIITHIERADIDVFGKAKVYPMAIYGLYMCAKKAGRILEMKDELLKYSDDAIKLLRKSRRQCYLLQILKMREELLGDEQTKIEKQWMWAIKYVYKYYGISLNINLNCYIYYGTAVYCIGKVIKKRREMFRISRNKLADGVCDVKTLLRIENQKNNVRQESINSILDKLVIPGDFIRLPIVTDNEKAIALYDELRYVINQSNSEKQNTILLELVSLLDMDNAYNSQIIGITKAVIERNNGEISSLEYEQKLLNSLEKTVPFSTISTSDSVFLTNAEALCIYNIAKEMHKNGNHKDIFKNIISKLCSNIDDFQINNTMNFMLQIWLADVKGNAVEYKESNKIADNAACWTLKSGRIAGAHICMYNNLWNNLMYSTVHLNDSKKTLKACIYLSDFAQDNKNYALYIKKYHSML